MKLEDSHKNQRFMLVGDGLSQIQVKTFTNILSNDTYSIFDEEHENNMIIMKALKRVVNITGDLHGGYFHFLQETYTLFFRILIQPVQALPGWKRIKVSDVTTCYQQAEGLTIIMDE